jgi:hypothetical protein
MYSGLITVAAHGVPAAPTNLTYTLDGYNLKLHWSDNSTNETGFDIEQFKPGIGFVIIGKVDPNITYYTDFSAPLGLNYYQVQAINSAGRSLATNEISVAVGSNTFVSVVAPSVVRTEALSSTQILLSWQGDGGATSGYTVQRSTNGTTGWTTVGTSTAGNRTFLDKNLTANTKYFYRIIALGSSATATSDVVSGVTFPV